MSNKTQGLLGNRIVGAVLQCALAFIVTTAVIGFSIVTFFAVRAIVFIVKQPGHELQTAAPTIYAQTPELRVGEPGNAEWLARYLKKLDYRIVTGRTPSNAEFSLEREGVVFRSRKDSKPIQVQFRGNRISSLKEGGSDPLQEYSLEPIALSQLFGSSWEKRTLIRYEDAPAHLIHALIAIEDRRFFNHSGVDVIAIARAAYSNLVKKSEIQGGSTITQQLVRNLYLTRERSLERKFKEAVMAFILERKLSKKEILELYMNEIYLGQQGPANIHGIAEAARLYFKKDIRNLRQEESALLAGMIQAPRRYNPYTHPDKAMERRNTVLRAMLNEKFINSEEYDQYTSMPVRVLPFDLELKKAPYFVDHVRQQLNERFSPDDLRKGLKVYTTLDIDMQTSAEEALTAGLKRIDKIRGRRVSKPVQGCLIAADLRTGKIRAYVGGRDYEKSQYDRIRQALRQPGSAFKPFVYAAALESAFESSNRFFTPATLLSDQPWESGWRDYRSNTTWQPSNHDGEYHGVVSARKALAQSMNVAVVRLAQEVGLHKIASLSRSFGFENTRPYPSIALGSFEASPWQLIQAYTPFGNFGKQIDLVEFEDIRNTDGDSLLHQDTQSVRILHEQTAYVITDLLKSVVTSGTGGAIPRMGLTRPIAGKTGTSDQFRDAWFIGYTPDLIALVWVGYDDNTSLGLNAAQAAVPIWADFMKRAIAHAPVKSFQKPGGILQRTIDPTTGKLATPYCYNISEEVFIQGTEPLESCNDLYHSMPAEYFASPEMRERNSGSDWRTWMATEYYPDANQDEMDPNFVYTYDGTNYDTDTDNRYGTPEDSDELDENSYSYEDATAYTDDSTDTAEEPRGQYIYITPSSPQKNDPDDDR